MLFWEVAKGTKMGQSGNSSLLLHTRHDVACHDPDSFDMSIWKLCVSFMKFICTLSRVYTWLLRVLITVGVVLLRLFSGRRLDMWWLFVILDRLV